MTDEMKMQMLALILQKSHVGNVVVENSGTINVFGSQVEQEASPTPDIEEAEVVTEQAEAETTVPSGPVTDDLVAASGIRGNYAREALETMYRMREQMRTATCWAAVYCVLLDRGWIEENTAAYCQLVERVTGKHIDNSFVGQVLRDEGTCLEDWKACDLRRKKARQTGMEYDEAIQDIIDARMRKCRQR